VGLPRTVLETAVPHVVGDVNDAIQVTAGFDHTCALIGTGRVRCWGADNVGQLGNERTGVDFGPQLVVGLPPTASVSAGLYATCALLTGGLVRCWGLGTSGQRGIGTRSSASYPSAYALVRPVGTT
jgi:alpha-tubulin suppressor-like RCC1 family protein